MKFTSCHHIPPMNSIFVLCFLLILPVFSIRQNNQVSNESEKMKLIRTHLKKINKPFVKSIKSPDGDIIDCVPFHLQPAFDLPELKSTVLLNPPLEPLNGNSKTEMKSSLKQKWSSNGESCPRRTIPIRRTNADEISRYKSISILGKKSNTRSNKNSVDQGLHEYAIGYVKGEYYGVNATLNVWAPKVRTNGFSLSQIWLAADVSSNDMNSIEAGWQVYPRMYGDDAPRFFIYWTSEAYKNGCYNLLCSGFVQTNNNIALGAAIKPISTYNGVQYDINLLIWKDPNSNDWWLSFEKNVVGYWPSTLFTGLQEHAEFVEFGGEVVHREISDSHTPTQMGSGHFAKEGYGKASFIKNIEVINGLNKLNPVSGMNLHADKPNCYDVTGAYSHNGWGSYIYFGGPGNNCQN